jgi:glutaminyl-peptide cyclotransferase
VTRLCAVVLFACALCACSRNPQQVSAADSQAPKAAPAASPSAASTFDGQRALDYTRDVVAFGPRWVGSPGYAKTQAFLRAERKGDNLEEDKFTASTPAGPLAMTNFIAKFPGTKDGIIVVCGHYDTLYKRNDFVGANDAGSSTGLLLELARELQGRNNDGYSVWVVFLDGEEAIRKWSANDSLYGSRHLAARWAKAGVDAKIKALLLVDMVGDADLNIERDSNSTPWLEDVVGQAAARLGYSSHFFARTLGMEDDHLPFAREGVPAADLIDFSYGPPTDNGGGAYWHTAQDTMDKLSAESLKIVGGVVLETIQLLNHPQ